MKLYPTHVGHNWRSLKSPLAPAEGCGCARPPESSSPSGAGGSSSSRTRPPRSLAGSLRRSAYRRFAVGMLLVAGCALGVTAPARADVLLSNLGQAADAGKSSFYLAHAQGFRTGENSGGYTLTSVETDLYGLDTAELAKLTVSIHTADNLHSNSAHHGQPLTPSLGTLTNPASVPGGSTFKFTTPGIHLAAETWYSVVLKPVGYRGIWLLGDSEGAILTVSTSLDASSKTGWRIAQHSWTRNPHSAGWSTGRQFLKTRFNGTEVSRPTASDNTVTATEDTAYRFTATEFKFSGSDPSFTLASVKIVTLPELGTGVLTLDDATVSAGDTVTRAQLDNGEFIYDPPANGNSSASFTFKVSDGTSKASDGTRESVSPYTMTIDVTAVNDPPTARDNAVTTNENTDYTFTADNFNFLDDDTADTLASVKIGRLPGSGKGTLMLNGKPVSAHTAITIADLNASNLTYRPPTNVNSPDYASFTFKVSDGTTESISYTMTIHLAATASHSAVTPTEDTDYRFTVADFNFSGALTSVKIVTLPGKGVLKLINIPATSGVHVSNADLNAGRLIYSPPANANGADYADFTFTVDNSAAESVPYTMTIHLTAVNDPATGAPTIADPSLWVGQTLVASPGNIADMDGLSSPNYRYQWVQVDGGSETNILGATSTSYMPVSGDVGKKLRVKFTFTDDDRTTETLASPATLAVLAAANTRPTASNNAVATNEDTNYTFTAARFNFLDEDSVDTLASVKIVTPPEESSTGTLTLNGAAVSAGAVVTRAQLDASRLIYRPLANANGNSHASFTFSVSDGRYGSAAESVPYTMTIHVTAVDDPATGAPTIADPSLWVGQTLVASPGNIADVDGLNSPNYRYQWVQVDGGSETNILGATSTSYMPVPGDVGKKLRVKFTFTDDDGTTGTLASPATLAVLAAANTRPTASNNAVTIDEDTNYTFTATSFNFLDEDSVDTLASVKIVTPPESSTGALTLDGAAVSAGAVVTKAQLDASRLIYAPLANANGNSHASFTFSVSDGRYGSAAESVPYTMTIHVTAVDDPATGVPFIGQRAPRVDLTTLVADTGQISDMDGPISLNYRYQWVQVNGLTGTDIDGATSRLYKPVSGDVGQGLRVRVSFTDNGGTINTLTSATTLPVLAGANTPPTARDSEVTTRENTAYRFTTADFNFRDSDPGHSLDTVMLHSLSGYGTDFGLQYDGVNIVLTGTHRIRRAALDAGRLTYRSPANATGDPWASFTFSVGDGRDHSTSSYTMSIKIEANNPPTASDSEVTIYANRDYTFKAADFNFVDVDGEPINHIYTRTLPASDKGALRLNSARLSSAVTSAYRISKADLDTGQLIYRPLGGASGAGYTSFTFSVFDRPLADLASSPAYTMTINVTTINRPPVARASEVTATGDTAYPFTAVDFNFVDVNSSDALANVKIVTLPGASTGVLTLDDATVSAGDTVTRAQLDANDLIYDPPANANGASYASFTFEVSDGALYSALSYRMTIHVRAVNDPPTARDNTVTAIADGHYKFAAVDFNFADQNVGDTFTSLRIVTAPVAGFLQLNGLYLNDSATISKTDIDARGLTYQPRFNASVGSHTSFTFEVSDGALYSASSYRMTINIEANLVPTADNKTVTIDEDTAYTFTADDFNFRDRNPGHTLKLLSARALTIDRGFLQYNDVNITDLTTLVIHRAGLDAERLTYRPPANGNGADYATFSFKVSDGYHFSATSYITIHVTAVNDPPTGAPSTGEFAPQVGQESIAHRGTIADVDGLSGPNYRYQWIQVDGVTETDIDQATSHRYTPVSGDLGKRLRVRASFTDDGGTTSTLTSPATLTVQEGANTPPTARDSEVTTIENTAYRFTTVDFNFLDSDPGDSLEVVRLYSLPGYGTDFGLQYDGVHITHTRRILRAALDAGRLTYRSPANATGDPWTSFTFRVGDGRNTSASDYTMNIKIRPNNRPTASDKAVTTNEDTAYPFTATNFNFADVDADTLASVTIVTLPSSGKGALELNGNPVSVNAIVTRVELDAMSLIYAPPANANGMDYADFTFTVNDSFEDSASASAMTIHVTAVNDPPTARASEVTIYADSDYTFKAADFNFVDVDGEPLSHIYTRTLPAPDKGALRLNGQPISDAISRINKADLDAGRFIYRSPSNASDAGYASFTFSVFDRPLADVADSPAYPMTINVTTVNHLPTARASEVTTKENTAYPFTATDFNFTDVNSSDALSNVKIVTLPGAGTGVLTLDNATVRADDTVTRAQLDANDLIYTPPANANGASYASFTFKVSDGTADSASSYTMTINIEANLVPTASNNAVTIDEDTNHTFTALDFNFIDGNPDHTLKWVIPRSLPTSGRGFLQYNGVDITTVGAVIRGAELDAERLTYAPPANANGASYASFTFQVSDGHAFSVEAYTMTIHVTAVNDPPTGAPKTSQRAPRVGEAVIAGPGNIADVDGLNSPDYSYQWVQVDGVSETDIDQATSRPYTPVSGDVGKSLRVRVSFTDDGGTTSTLTTRVSLPVLAGANTRPTARDSEVTTRKNTAYRFTTVDFNFLDSDPGDSLVTVRLHSLPGYGTDFGLQYDGVNIILTHRRRIPRAALDAGRLTYRSPANATGDPWTSFTFSVDDGRDTSASHYTMSIKIPNNPPTANDNAVTTNEDTAYPFTAANFNFAEVGADTLASVTIVTLPSSDQGALELNGDPVSVNAIVTRVELDAMYLIYTPLANANGMDYASFTFTVNDSSEDSASAMTIHVTAVNDPPTARASKVTIYADSDYTFKAADFNFVDVDGEPLSHIYTRTLPATDKGALRLNDQPISDAISRINKADLDAGRFIYRPPSKASGTGYASFTFSVFDGHPPAVVADSPAYPMTINVTTLNHTPTASASEVTAIEDTAYPFTADDFNLTDVNSSDVLSNVKIVTLPRHGTGVLTLDSATVRAGDTVTRVQLDANDLIYAPPANANGASYASFTFKVSDGHAFSTSSYPMTVHVTAVNDPPTGVPRISELAPRVGQVLIASDGNIADVDGLSSPDYRYQWVQVDGVSETDIDATSEATPHLYTPVSGDVGKSLRVRVRFTDDGGTTSTLTSPATLPVLAGANTPPTARDSEVTTIENTAYRFTTTDFNFVDSDPGHSLVTVRLRSLPKSGTGFGLQYDGVVLTYTRRISRAALDDGRLTYRSPANVTGDPWTSFTFSVSDGRDISSYYTMNIKIRPNNRPTASDKAVTTNEDTAYPFTATNFNFADVDDDTLASVRLVTLPSSDQGALKLNGDPVSVNAIVTRVELDAMSLIYAPPANANGMDYADFTFTVNDSFEDSASASAMTIHVTAVNDPPTARASEVTIYADSDYTFKAADFNFVDVDGEPLSHIYTRTLPAADKGALRLNDQLISDAISRINKADLDAGRFIYRPPSNASGAGYASFTFSVFDGHPAAVAGSLAYPMTINVTTVNHLPTASASEVTTTERTAYPFTATDFNFTDVNSSDVLSNVKIVTLPGLGTGVLTLDSATVRAGDTVTKAQLDANDLIYAPPANAYGAGSASFTFKVSDGTADSASSYTMTINIEANLVPTASNNAVTIDEDTAHTFTATDFNFRDGNPDHTLKVLLPRSLPTSGRGFLQYNGIDLTSAAFIIHGAGLDAERLTYRPPANANGASYASFTFQVSDGLATSVEAYTMTIHVTAVNDPPTGQPTISGEAQVGQTLTADTSDIEDVDGLVGVSYRYQWIRVDGAGTGTDISGATSRLYQTTVDDLGKTLRVKATFTDDGGNAGMLTSVATGTVGLPVVRIVASGAAVTEGTEATFTLTAAPAPTSDITVTVTVTDGGDFAGGGQTGERLVTIRAGNTTATLTVATVNDATDEPHGAITATVTRGTGYSAHNTLHTASAAINDDDDPSTGTPVVSVSGGMSVTEGTVATFTLTADPAPDSDITVTVMVTERGAFAVGGQTGTKMVTINTNGTATLTVTTFDDTSDESNGAITAAVTRGTGYSAHNTAHTASVTVNDNDDPSTGTPVVSVSGGPTVTEGTAATFTLTASPRPDSDISVTVTVTDSGFFASRGQTGTRMVTINTSGTATLTVTTLGDTIDEPNGAITAAVTRGTGYSAHNTAHTAPVTVNDDDATALTLTGPKGAITEGDTKAFTVNLNRGLVDGESLVAPLTLTGSATQGTDYTLDCASATGVACASLNSGTATVTFTGPNSGKTATSMTITLTALADNAAETAETVVIGLGTLRITGLDGVATTTDTLADFSIVDPTPVADFDLDLRSASEDAGTRNVTVNLSPAAPHAGITLTYNVGGTATAGNGNDFTIADSGSVTLLSGATSVNIPVLIADDNADESAETVLLTLTAGNGYTVGAKSVHTLTINDNDATVVTLTGPKGDVTEGDTKAFIVSLSRALVDGESLVAPLTLTGSAARGTDYTLDCAGATGVVCASLNSGSATVTFTGSSSATTATSMTITLTAAADTTAEPAETVVIGLGTLRITGLDGVATTTDTLADFSIVDPTPVADFDLALHSASEGAGTRNVTVNLSPAAPHAGITLTYNVGGTATAGSGNDFTIANSGSVTLPSGATSVNIPVLIVDDNADESAETVLLTLTAGNGYTVGAISVHTLTINDNDATVVTLTGPKGDVTEGDTKAFTVNLSRALVDGESLVAPLTLTGSAARGTDYTLDCAGATGVVCASLNSGSATVTFTGSSSATTATSMTITLTAAADTTAEPAETVVIGLGTLRITGLDGGATTTDTLADFSIVDPTPVADFNLALHSASEGAGTRNVTVNLSPAVPHAGITLTYNVGGTATAGSGNDFTIADSGSVTLPAGATSVNIPVLIADDNADESAETVLLTLTAGNGYTVGAKSVHTLTINDNDDPPKTIPVVSVSGGMAVTEGTAATFTLTADPAPDSDISVTVMVTDRGFFASRGQTGTRMVTINTSGTATLTVTTLGDTIDEPNGAITAAVTRGTGYSAHNTTHTASVTVNDDDATALTLTGPKGDVTEGDTKAFTVNLNRGLVDGESLVASLTLTGSATRGTDYTLDCASATGVACAGLNSGSATVTFAGSSSATTATSMTITLTAAADTTAEPAETVVIGLGTPTATGLGGGATPTATLADFSIVDPTPVAAFDLDLHSASEDAGTRNVTVNLSPAAPHAGITLTYSVGGTATAGGGNDFTIADSGSVTLTVGATSVNIPVLIADDNADESAETVLLTLTAGNGYTVGAISVHTLTINDNDATVVTLTGPKGNVTEGDTKAFTVSLDRGLVNGEILVAPLTLTGSATRGTDYTLDCASATGVACAGLNSGSATVTFAGSSSATTATSMTITLTAAPDTTAEPAETVVIGLGTPTATGLDGVATTTDTLADFSIVDPTPVAAFDLDLHSASEDAGTRNVTVNLSPAAPHAGITLTYSVGGTATAGGGNDFTIADSGSVTLTVGATSVNIPVLIADDNADESAETVLLTLTAGNGYTVGAISVHTLTINDNDATVVTLTGPKGNVTEGDTKAFTVSLDRGLVNGEILVAPLTLTGSATRGTDYTLDCASATGVACAGLNSGSATVTFAGSSSATTATSMTITLTAAPDTTAEPAETVVIGLGTPTATGLDGVATTTDTLADFSIVDPTPVAAFDLDLHSASEDAGTRNVTVNLSPAAPHAGITLTYSVGGTATAGSSNDFTIVNSGSVTLTVGAISVNIPVLIADDNADESAETVLLTLTPASGYTVGSTSVHTLTINDDDATALTLVGSTGNVTEGDTKEFTVSLDRALVDGEILVAPLTFTGTATRGTDYTLACASASDVTCANLNSGGATVTFTGSSSATTATSMTITLTAAADTTAEPTAETVVIGLGRPTATGLDGGATTTATLADFSIVDPTPVAAFDLDLRSVSEDAGTHNVTVNLSPAAPHAGITLTYSVGGTATAGSGNDFTIANSGSVTLPSGATSVNIPVLIADDNADENAETVLLTLTPASGYTVGATSVHTLTINDNDNPAKTTPVVSVSGGMLVTEGTAATFTLTADPAPDSDISVTVMVTDSGAFAVGGQTGTKMVTINTNGTATLTVTTLGDTIDEPNGAITAAVTGGTGYSAHNTTHTASVTVNDDDDPSTGTPVVSVSGGPAVTEGTAATFTLTADPAPDSDISVTVMVTDSGAFAVGGQTGTKMVTINTNGTATLTVTTLGDTTDEPTGAITAAVTGGTGYSAHNTTHTASVTVNDDDATALTLTGPKGDVTEGDTKAFTVNLSRALVDGESLVAPLTLTGSATRGTDYTLDCASATGVACAGLNSGSATVTFTGSSSPTTATSMTITLTAAADTTAEPTAETVVIGLGTPTPTGLDGGATTTDTLADFSIVDPTPVAAFDLDLHSASEDAGTHNVTVNLSPAAPHAGITLNYRVGGTATAGNGNDFTIANSGSVTLPLGATSVNIPVMIVDDNADESAETVLLTLTPASGYAVGSTNVHTLTINDNDDPSTGTPVVSVSGGAAVTEGADATFTLTATPAPAGAISVTVMVTDSGAFAGGGQTGTKTVTINTSGTAMLTVTTVNDTIDESNGAITAAVTNGTGYSAHNTAHTASVTINDNDSATGPPPANTPPAFGSASSVRVAENESAVLAVTAVEPDAPDGAVRYRLSGGADQARFLIDPETGALTFAGLPDYENPDDSAGNNEYIVTVRATSGAGERERSAEQTITVTVTDVYEIFLEPGTPVREAGLYQQGRTTITVTNTASTAASVTLPHPILDANGAPFRRLNIELADALSTPLPDQTEFGFDPDSRVDIDVSPAPKGGVELCLPVSGELRLAAGGQPLHARDFTSGTWRALPSADKGDQVCAAGVSTFSPFMASFSAAAASMERTLPAWLARFGRTVTDQVLEAVTDRLAAPRSPGMKVSLAGRALPIRGQDNAAREDRPAGNAGSLRANLAERGALDALRNWISHTGAEGDDLPHGAPGAGSRALQSWSPTGRDWISGTSFALTGEPRADGALLSVWGRGALTNFAGRDGDLALDGEAQTLLVGAERSWRGWTTGGVLGRSRVEGGYRSAAETGEIEATLTGVYPWAGRAVNDQVSAWAALGYGAGDLTLQPKDGDPIRADLSLALGAAGLRGEVLRPLEAGGLSLAVKGDVRFTRVASKAAGDTMVGRLMAAEADVWRVRAGVEGARSFMANDDAWATVTPSFEVGVRLDGGDAETGFGADVGGGVALVDPGRGVTLEMKARGLAAHEAEGFREWGASAALAWEPRPQSGRGLSLSLTQSWGASSSGGMDALLSRDTLVGLAASDTAPAGRRLEAELGYGMTVFGGDFTATPNAGLTLTEDGRDWRLGWRLTPAWPDGSGFEVNLDATRSETDDGTPVHAVTLRGALRF